MGRFVIAAYRPKEGRAAQLRSLVQKHMSVLAAEGLVTDRPAYAMSNAEGVILEVFEWRSAQAIRQAHENPAVLALWSEFEAVCEYAPLASLSEAQQPFAEFEPFTP